MKLLLLICSNSLFDWNALLQELAHNEVLYDICNDADSFEATLSAGEYTHAVVDMESRMWPSAIPNNRMSEVVTREQVGIKYISEICLRNKIKVAFVAHVMHEQTERLAKELDVSLIDYQKFNAEEVEKNFLTK